jgi:hypothetical protein
MKCVTKLTKEKILEWADAYIKKYNKWPTKDSVMELKEEPLTEEKILEWADAYHEKYGVWPTADSVESI